MATEVKPVAVGEIRAASTTGGGTALTTTVTRILLPLGTQEVTLIPRNAAGGAVVCKFNFNPFLTVLKTTDDHATFTDYSTEAQDGSTSTDITLSSLGTLVNGDALYVGAHVPFSGLVVDVDLTNSTASVLTGSYWDGSAWVSLSVTDGSAAAGATFGQDGDITWTVPSAWVEGAPHGLGHVSNAMRFWARFTVSAALDSTTTLNSLLAITRNTTYGELPFGMTYTKGIRVVTGGWASVNALTDAGTGNLIVNVETRPDSRFS